MDDTWSNEKCLELIDIYEKCPDLWDCKHPLYYHKKNRIESWQKIATHFDTDIMSTKRKMFSLLGSFRIQKAKGKEIVGDGLNMKEVYVSKWFAFEKMAFLLDQKEPHQEAGSDSCDIAYETFEIKTESDSEIEYYDNGPLRGVISPISPIYNIKESQSTEQPITHNEDLTKTKQTETKRYKSVEIPFIDVSIQNSNKSNQRDRKCSTSFNNIEENLNKRKFKEISINNEYQYNKKIRIDTAQHNNGNNCVVSDDVNFDSIQIFGQYIASKLQRYSSKTRAIAEHSINNVLFEADLGWYENSSPKR